MSQFEYTLPSGASFVMQAPQGTTQSQADLIFYSQVAAGALVGFVPGQSISAAPSSLAKFELSRLDRGVAGVDDTVILAIVNGLPTATQIPPLIDVPLENPITQSDIAEITSTGFTAPPIGSLTSNQTQALMAQVANSVNQPSTQATDDVGIGRYGFSCQQLEMAGYVKPGTWQRFLQNTSNTLTQVLDAPGIWTGLNGIDNLTEFLNNINAQNDAQARLMVNGYNSLQAVGVITPPASAPASTVRGRVYTGNNQSLTSTTTTVTNELNSRVAALVTNSSRYGTQLTSQWASATSPGAAPIKQNNSNLAAYAGIGIGLLSKIPNLNLGSIFSGGTPSLPSVKTAMDALGKASQFASTAASTLQRGLSNLSVGNVSLPSLSSLTAGLPNLSSLTGNLPSISSLTANLPNVSSLTSQLPSFSDINVTSLLGGTGDSLVASVQKAAGFSNTVNRATVDVAMTKIFGSNKIPLPSLGPNLPDSESIKAALDINKAETVLKDLQGQGSALLNQAQGQIAGLSNQVQGQASNILTQARTVANRIT